uniref:Putative transmembrane and ubiquitin-like domain-containing protein 2 n=1 Tax=Tabanus bromius TaxID=304241 RepID=A0A0K8TPK1_TABBR
MTLLEDIGQQITNLAVILVSSVIVYFAWRSTNVQDDILPPTVVLSIENNRRRLLERVARESINVGSTSTNSSANRRAIETVEEQINDLLESDSDSGPQRIIEDMDNPDTAEGLRRRRLAFYENEGRLQSENSDGGSNSQHQSDLSDHMPRIRRENLNIQTENDVDSSHAENCSNENNENESKSQIDNVKPVIVTNIEPTPSAPTETKEDEFRIKLKYLNDELRLVTGTPNEAIGDFKKRNFTVELSAQKIIRLVFNGHVLQPDSKTLQACGLFDNCVVHCLIHNKKPSASNYGGENRTNVSQDQPETAHTGLGTNTFSERSGNGPLLVYLGMIFLSLGIIFSWYCRIQYSHLFSWYSTSGLVLMTVLHLVMFPLIILIEREVTN